MSTDPKSLRPDADLRALAERATPGPWVLGEEQLSPMLNETVTVCNGFVSPRGPWSEPNLAKEDAAFIAAANPTAILALLDAKEGAEGELEQAKNALEGSAKLLNKISDRLALAERVAEAATAEAKRHRQIVFRDELLHEDSAVPFVVINYMKQRHKEGCALCSSVAVLDAAGEPK